MKASRWGDFGGRCLVSACRPTEDLFLPDGNVLGLDKMASYLLGTWRTEDGEIYRILREIQPYHSPYALVFSTHDGSRLSRLEKVESNFYRGGISTLSDGNKVTFSPSGSSNHFHHEITNDHAAWIEKGVLEVQGVRSAPANQWYNPWRNGGGGFAVTTKFRASGALLGKRVDGFFAHEVHYFPRNMNFMISPYGFGGREVHWGHMSTAFDDGKTIDASLAFGRDGWGFAMFTDEQGAFHSTTELNVDFELRKSGYPERIHYSFLGQELVWQIEPAGERAAIGDMGLVGAEGILRRKGDARKVVAAMGTIDWWTEGRARNDKKSAI